MDNLPSIQTYQNIKPIQKSKSSKIVRVSTAMNTVTSYTLNGNLTSLINSNSHRQIENNCYDYFNSKIPKSQIDKYLRIIKDEKFLFFINYGILRRYEGDCEIIYIEIPQIPKKLVVYRRTVYRMKALDKLILNNKDLPHIPLFESEDKLKYLSLELNHISKIEQLISLNSLLFLNLYGNNIKEIENLNTVKKLKVLLLGRNNISKIKNLNYLVDLEIIDLHNNKIKYVEGLSNLKKLRILNISNNLICSFYELIYNKNLEELNLRKNLISAVPNILNGYFGLLKKINIGKNLINKLQFLEEFTKIKSLKEIILEYNPVLNNPDAIFYINKLPIKGKIPILLYKSSIENNSNRIIKNFRSNEKLNKIGNLLFYKNKINNVINFHTQQINRIGSNIRVNDNIKQNIKMMTINKQWLEEYHDIIVDGYNGYNNKKFKETHIDQGYIEVEGEKSNCLNLYGNCLKILMNNKLYENINILKFNYFCFDLIMSKKFMKYLKLFKNIKQFNFNYNNIFSVYQLTKLELFENLECIQINNNEISSSGGFIKNFLIYRIRGLKTFNNEDINDEDKILSKNIFLYFDNVILQKEKEKELKLKKEKKNNINENNKLNCIIYKEDNYNDNIINNVTDNDNENYNKLKMWNYVKNNLESAIFSSINDLEEI